jgi:hypothetical protein
VVAIPGGRAEAAGSEFCAVIEKSIPIIGIILGVLLWYFLSDHSPHPIFFF